jgi:hypothetical protein
LERHRSAGPAAHFAASSAPGPAAFLFCAPLIAGFEIYLIKINNEILYLPI